MILIHQKGNDMHIDFHHAATYVAARMAGFEHKDADIIAYSAQYVDDATEDGVVEFHNGAKYSRTSSAHKMLDYRNFAEMANQKVWVPFHFLPGNDGLPDGSIPEEGFIKKLVCQPNSVVAIDMIDGVIRDAHLPYGLYRLGISMHVYADTFAHQGFAGVNHKINEVDDLTLHNEEVDMTQKLKSFFGDIFEPVTQKFLSDAFPLGHGAALTCPDKPYLKWSYTNGLGEPVERDNPQDFYAAVEMMTEHMMDYRRSLGLPVPEEINRDDMNIIEKHIKEFTNEEGEVRHAQWLDSIAAGDFSFGAQRVEYIGEGRGSWKHNALNTLNDDMSSKYAYANEFLRSDWKLFHDALQAHHFDVVHNILPKYGICVA